MLSRIRKPVQLIKARPMLPASKSISNRLIILQALSGKNISLDNLSDSDDTSKMLELLGSDGEVKDVGHAGTTMRFLTAFYALREGTHIMTGSGRMKQRPIAELVRALQKLGAEIDYMENEGYPPIKIRRFNSTAPPPPVMNPI